MSNDNEPHILIIKSAHPEDTPVLFLKDNLQAAKDHQLRVKERCSTIGYTGKIYRIEEVTT